MREAAVIQAVTGGSPVPQGMVPQVVVAAPATAVSRLVPMVELTKPRIGALVLVATGLGFFVGLDHTPTPAEWLAAVHTLLATALVAGGANALNQYLEAAYDAQMVRTRNRPIPSARLSADEALLFGVLISAGGVLYLLAAVNSAAAGVAAATLALYLFAYTPLKRVTPLAVYVGAAPGALPPLIGWAAATGTLPPQAWLIFAILFLWQLPHFAAIAWLYREDYRRAGYRVLTAVQDDGRLDLHLITHTVGLIAASLLPTLYGLAGAWYAFGAMALGLAFLGFGVQFVRSKTQATARWHLLASIAYVPALLTLMLVDRV